MHKVHPEPAPRYPGQDAAPDAEASFPDGEDSPPLLRYLVPARDHVVEAGADDAYATALERWLDLGGADLDERAGQVAGEVGLSVAMADGSVRAVNRGMDPATWRRLMLPRDGEPITGEW